MTRWASLIPLALGAQVALADPLARPLALKSDDYGESYSFIADLEDRTFVLLQLGVSNLGPGTNHGICRALVVSPAGEAWTDNELVDGWRHALTHVGERLSIGGCALTIGPSSTLVTASLDGTKVSLSFAERPRPAHAPGSPIAIAGGRHEQHLWLRATSVLAIIEREGEARRTVKGRGYGDRALSDADPAKIARRWVRFRALDASPPILMQSREAPDGREGPGWVITGSAAASLGKITVDRRGKSSFVVRDGAVTITSGALVYRYAPIEDLGVVGSVISPFVGSPVSYTTRATWSDGVREVRGLLDVEYANDP